MSFFENLLLGLIGSELIEDAERLHNQHLKEREQRRYDSLFWQDAAKRKDPFHDNDAECW